MNTQIRAQIIATLSPHMSGWNVSTMTDMQLVNTVVRACIAHQLNGGAYTDPISTAREYLQSIGDQS